MSMRKMWAPGEDSLKGAYRGRSLFQVSSTKTVAFAEPVFVLDATGAPDFVPGDQVREVGLSGATYTVDGLFIDRNGLWTVAVYDKRGEQDTFYADGLERVPAETSTETTTLLRVTGPEEAVVWTVERLEINAEPGVRVEIVEDER